MRSRGLLYTTGGDYDRLSELRLKELAVSTLKKFTLGHMFYGLRVYDLSDLVWFWVFGDGLSELFCIARIDSASNAMSVRSALGSVTEYLRPVITR